VGEGEGGLLCFCCFSIGATGCIQRRFRACSFHFPTLVALGLLSFHSSRQLRPSEFLAGFFLSLWTIFFFSFLLLMFSCWLVSFFVSCVCFQWLLGHLLHVCVHPCMVLLLREYKLVSHFRSSSSSGPGWACPFSLFPCDTQVQAAPPAADMTLRSPSCGLYLSSF
jgi:hypothetical protein